MARYWNNNGSNGGGQNWNSNSGNWRNQQQQKPFDLITYATDLVDIYTLLKSKADEAGVEIPPDALARWATSAKISMDK